MLIILLIGIALASCDLVIFGIDFLPDVLGYLLLAVATYMALHHKKMKIGHLVLIGAALACSIAQLFINRWLLSLILLFVECGCFFAYMRSLIRRAYPVVEKGTTDEFWYKACLWALFFIVITDLFGFVLAAIFVLNLLVLVVKFFVAAFLVFALWRRKVI